MISVCRKVIHVNLVVKAKLPLHWATRILADLCDQVDESPELSDALLQAFKAAAVSHAESIDRRKALMWAIEGSLKAARGARAEVDAYVQRLKAIAEKVKLTTKEAMQEAPDLPWKDSVGRKLTLAKNAEEKLILSFDVKAKRTFTNLVHSETVRMFDIPEKYLKRITVTLLDSDAIKADLAAGVSIMWAEAKRDFNVRGLMPPKDQEIEDVQTGEE